VSRILVVLSVAALMAAMLVAMAMPAFAAKPTTSFPINCVDENAPYVGYESSALDGRPVGSHNRAE
jgi:hypothetical protein